MFAGHTSTIGKEKVKFDPCYFRLFAMQSNLFTAVLLPLALSLVMLGMGLSLIPEDFWRIRSLPQSGGSRSICQVVLLPIIALLITQIVPMQPTIAVGLIVLALCCGGPSSNLITYLAKGDVALSVSLTAVGSIITVFTIPIFSISHSSTFSDRVPRSICRSVRRWCKSS